MQKEEYETQISSIALASPRISKLQSGLKSGELIAVTNAKMKGRKPGVFLCRLCGRLFDIQGVFIRAYSVRDKQEWLELQLNHRGRQKKLCKDGLHDSVNVGAAIVKAEEETNA